MTYTGALLGALFVCSSAYALEENEDKSCHSDAYYKELGAIAGDGNAAIAELERQRDECPSEECATKMDEFIANVQRQVVKAQGLQAECDSGDRTELSPAFA